MKKKKINKKGISPMIATILLIAFIVAIIILVFLWGKNYIEELAQKRGALAEKKQECTKIKIEVVKACWRGSQAEVAIRNQANIPIHKFIFVGVGSSGEPAESTSKLGGLETKSYPLEFSSDPGQISKIEIIPHLRVALGHYVPCSKQKVTSRLTGSC